MPRPATQRAHEPEAAPVRTPARQRLADAFATLADREEQLAETRAALVAAENERDAASQVLRDAEAALERARPRSTAGYDRPRSPLTFGREEDYLAYEAELNAPPIPIDAALTAVETARNARDSAVRAVQFHEERLGRLDFSVRTARSDVGDCVKRVILFDPALAALATEAKRLATRAAAAAMAFETATGGDVIPLGSPFHGCTRPANARDSAEAMSDWSVSRAWSEAIKRLSTDPDAPLPM